MLPNHIFSNILLCSVVAAILFNVVTQARADEPTTPAIANTSQHIGSDLPLLGDVAKAAMFVRAGNVAAAAGNVHEAKNNYRNALSVSPTLEDATLGLARCATREGDFAAAIGYYQNAIYGHQEEFNIDLLTEYVLSLIQGGDRPQAIWVYNHVVGLCKQGMSCCPMQILPPAFLKNGSDYRPARIQAMTHLIRAMNSGTSNSNRMEAELHQAAALAPNSPLVYYYQGMLLMSKDKVAARKEFERARRMDDGSHEAAIAKAIAQTLETQQVQETQPMQ